MKVAVRSEVLCNANESCCSVYICSDSIEKLKSETKGCCSKISILNNFLKLAKKNKNKITKFNSFDNEQEKHFVFGFINEKNNLNVLYEKLRKIAGDVFAYCRSNKIKNVCFDPYFISTYNYKTSEVEKIIETII